MSASKVLLITGATGQQGGAVINSLLSSPEISQYTILAVTRDTTSSSAQKLASESPLIKLVQGSYDDLPGLFSRAQEITSRPVDAVFSVQVAIGKGASVELEEIQGKALIDESIKQGVKHFVQTSVERGGDEKSWTNPTNVPHFISKHNIELHLRDSVAQTPAGKEIMTWTILRPVAFMEGFAPGFQMKVFLATLRDTVPAQKPVQFIATQDIGWFAAQALLHPQSYKGQAIGLAGDSLTFKQLDDTFEKVLGHRSGATFGFIGTTFKWAVRELGVMIDWFGSDGFGVDVEKLRQRHPDLLDFETWMRTKSSFVKA